MQNKNTKESRLQSQAENETPSAPVAVVETNSLQLVVNHLEELAEAFRTGALSSCDGQHGARSNRNMDALVALRKITTTERTVEERTR